MNYFIKNTKLRRDFKSPTQTVKQSMHPAKDIVTRTDMKACLMWVKFTKKKLISINGVSDLGLWSVGSTWVRVLVLLGNVSSNSTD